MRLRRRRLLTAGALVAGLLAGCGGAADPDPVLSPTAPAALGPEMLLTDDDTVHSEHADWFTTEGADDPSPFRLCTSRTLWDFGATTMLWRDYELRDLDDGSARISGAGLRETVGELPDAAGARAAYDRMIAFVRRCAADLLRSDVLDPRPVALGLDDSAATIIEVRHREFSEIGILRVGDRIAVLDSIVAAQDADVGSPVARMLPRAAELLAK